MRYMVIVKATADSAGGERRRVELADALDSTDESN